MPFATNKGLKIYYEVAGQGPPIVLAHGATGDITFWRGYGYVDQLKDMFTVILFDARGHGRSDKPHTVEGYDYRLRVDDALVVMDALKIDKAHYWGYSMGGYIGFGLAKHCPERLKSLIIGGAAPYAVPNKSGETLLKIFEQGVDKGVEAVIKGIQEWAGSITPQYETRLRSLDLPAMAALFYYFVHHNPSFEDDLTQMITPSLIYTGETDEPPYTYGQQAAGEMPNASFYGLAGLNHVGASSATELIMPQVLSFLTSLEE